MLLDSLEFSLYLDKPIAGQYVLTNFEQVNALPK